MCRFITEEELLMAMLDPPRIKSLLLLTEGIHIVDMRFDTDISYLYYEEVKVTKKELFTIGLYLLDQLEEEKKELAVENLKKLNIHASLWYKYYEDNIPSISDHTLKETSIMNKDQFGNEIPGTPEEKNAFDAGRKQALLEAGRTFWANHGGKFKYAGLMFLGACVGAGAMAYADRRGDKTVETTTM